MKADRVLEWTDTWARYWHYSPNGEYRISPLTADGYIDDRPQSTEAHENWVLQGASKNCLGSVDELKAIAQDDYNWRLRLKAWEDWAVNHEPPETLTVPGKDG